MSDFDNTISKEDKDLIERVFFCKTVCDVCFDFKYKNEPCQNCERIAKESIEDNE